MPPSNSDDDYPTPKDVGILAMEMYFPKTYVEQKDLEVYHGVSPGKYTQELGQKRLAVCSDRIDISALCLSVTHRLLKKSGVDCDSVGFLMVGTETLIDKSKATKTVLMDLFKDNTNIEGIDTTNTSYGGTAALFHAVDWMYASSWDGTRFRYAIVVAADIADYEDRPTGGCGAVAMLIGPEAPIVFDSVRVTHMANTYNYKPSEFLDGSFTCYTKAIDTCYNRFLNHLEQLEERRISLNDFDGLLFHAPFSKLVHSTLSRCYYHDFLRNQNMQVEGRRGLEKYRTLSPDDTILDAELDKAFRTISQKMFEAKTQPCLLLATEIGNMCTASLYACLVSFLLSKPLDKYKNNRLLLFSYGSCLTASMFSLTITCDVSSHSKLAELIDGLGDVRKMLCNRIQLTPKELEKSVKQLKARYNQANWIPTGSVKELQPGSYYLVNVDEKFRRKY